jgi:tetratricopeptide (TPR) repeat protein
MKKKKFLYILLITLLISGSYTIYVKSSKKSKILDILEEAKKDNKKGLDSLQKAINDENNMKEKIIESIKNKNYEHSLLLIDSLPDFAKKHSTYLYKGMIYEDQNNFSKAIEEYTNAIKEIKYSIALAKRAEIYIKVKKINMALEDYKKIYEWNKDYSLNIADLYNSVKQRDSATKYYKIYLEHYPNDLDVLKRSALH